MKLVMRSASVDGNHNLRAWRPADPTTVSTWIRLCIGPKTSSGTDDFFVRVATPAGLADDDTVGVIAQRALIVVSVYDADVLWTLLQNTVASCEADTWLASVEKLRRFFNWEYDSLDVT
jgi:hypothetical protein